MDTQVKERQKPVRPHWMAMFKQRNADCKALQERLARLEGIEDVANRLKEKAAKMDEEFNDLDTNHLEKQLEAANAEIHFLRKTVAELNATLQQAIKVRE